MVYFCWVNYFIFSRLKKHKVMYGGYAQHRRIMAMLEEQRELIRNDPEYRKQYIEELGLEDLASQMTPELWKIADAKYGYKR